MGIIRRPTLRPVDTGPPPVFLNLSGTHDTEYRLDLSDYLFGIANIAGPLDTIDQILQGNINTGIPPLDALIRLYARRRSAANISKLYDALVKVDGYETMPVTEAAQAVQRSGFPDAYADHEADARVLASALSGNSRHAFSCRLGGAPDAASTRLTSSGLTHRADVVRREVDEVFGDPPMGGFAPGGVSTGHMSGSAHYDGRAVDVFVRPVSPANKVRGWAIAQYLVAMADRLDVQTVIFDDRIWTAGGRSGDGWREYDPPESAGDRAILEHRDHVHVDVYP